MGFLHGDLMVIWWWLNGILVVIQSVINYIHPVIYGDFHYVIVINGDKLWFMVI